MSHNSTMPPVSPFAAMALTMNSEDFPILPDYKPKTWYQERRERWVNKVLKGTRHGPLTRTTSAQAVDKLDKLYIEKFYTCKEQGLSQSPAGILTPIKKTCKFTELVDICVYEASDSDTDMS